MNIARVCSFFPPVEGGLEILVYEETKELVKLGNKVTVFTSDALREGRIAKKEEIVNKVKVYRLPTWCRFSYFTLVFPGVWWKALTASYDVMHVSSYRQPHNLCILIAKLRGKKAILAMHWPEYPKELRSSWINKIIPVFDKTLGKWIVKAADKIIVHTQAEKEWVMKKFGRKKAIEVVPGGISKDYLKRRYPLAFRKKYQIKGSMVLYVGRIHKSKGVHKIVEIASKFPETTFVIVGDGPERKDLENVIKAKKIKNIKMIGRVSEEEKIQAYAACDVFLHPAEFECFGITLVEAMAQGKPTLGSNVGGIPSVVGSPLLTFNKDDMIDLEKKLRNLLENKKLREEIGKQARKKAEAMTWDKIAQQLNRVYHT